MGDKESGASRAAAGPDRNDADYSQAPLRHWRTTCNIFGPVSQVVVLIQLLPQAIPPQVLRQSARHGFRWRQPVGMRRDSAPRDKRVRSAEQSLACSRERMKN